MLGFFINAGQHLPSEIFQMGLRAMYSDDLWSIDKYTINIWFAKSCSRKMNSFIRGAVGESFGANYFSGKHPTTGQVSWQTNNSGNGVWNLNWHKITYSRVHPPAQVTSNTANMVILEQSLSQSCAQLVVSDLYKSAFVNLIFGHVIDSSVEADNHLVVYN